MASSTQFPLICFVAVVFLGYFKVHVVVAVFFFTYLTGPGGSGLLLSVTRNDKTKFKINHFNIEYNCSQDSLLSIFSATWQGSVSVILSIMPVRLFLTMVFFIIKQFITWCLGVWISVWISVNCGVKWKKMIKRGMMALFKKRKTTAQKQFWTIGFTPAKNSPSRKIQTFRVQTKFSRKRRYDHWLFSQTNFPSSSKFSWERLHGSKECLWPVDFVAGEDLRVSWQQSYEFPLCSTYTYTRIPHPQHTLMQATWRHVFVQTSCLTTMTTARDCLNASAKICFLKTYVTLWFF